MVSKSRVIVVKGRIMRKLRYMDAILEKTEMIKNVLTYTVLGEPFLNFNIMNLKLHRFMLNTGFINNYYVCLILKILT